MHEPIQCVLHGSFNKHFAEIQRTLRMFESASIEVIAPKASDIAGFHKRFALLEGEENLDPRLIELRYLHQLKSLGRAGFSYFVNPEGYLVKSASYKLGIAQSTNTRAFFMEPPADLPVYIPANSVWSAQNLAAYYVDNRVLPGVFTRTNEKVLGRLWKNLHVPGSVVAAGAVIEHASPTHASTREKEILLVKTHKWSGRYSMVGGRVRRNERLRQALLREVSEDTGLTGRSAAHLCTFDQLEDSGYYQPGVNHIFADYVVQVESKRVQLNEEAQEYIWAPPREALAHLDIEPNARHTLQLYTGQLI